MAVTGLLAPVFHLFGVQLLLQTLHAVNAGQLQVWITVGNDVAQLGVLQLGTVVRELVQGK